MGGRVVGGESGGGVIVPVVVDEGHALEVGVGLQEDEIEFVEDEGGICGGVDGVVLGGKDAGQCLCDLAVAVGGAVRFDGPCGEDPIRVYDERLGGVIQGEMV